MKAKKTIVDSSVWIAYFYHQDSQHQQATKLLEAVTTQIVIPEYILLETLTIFRHKKEERAITDFLEIAMRKDVYMPSGTLGEEVAIYYAESKDKKLSFVDTGLLLLSKKYSIITLDKALQKAINK